MSVPGQEKSDESSRHDGSMGVTFRGLGASGGGGGGKVQGALRMI